MQQILISQATRVVCLYCKHKLHVFWPPKQYLIFLFCWTLVLFTYLYSNRFSVGVLYLWSSYIPVLLCSSALRQIPAQVSVIWWFQYVATGKVLGYKRCLCIHLVFVLYLKAFVCMFNFLLRSCFIDEINANDCTIFQTSVQSAAERTSGHQSISTEQC